MHGSIELCASKNTLRMICAKSTNIESKFTEATQINEKEITFIFSLNCKGIY